MNDLIDKLDMDEEEFDELMKLQDEVVDYETSVRKDYYVLQEHPETGIERIRIKNFHRYFPMEELHRIPIQSFDRDSLYIEVEEGYYPDYIEENGRYFVSAPFWEYLKQKLDVGNIEFNHVGFHSENGRRVEEYCLIVPYEVDCILEGSARYDKAGRLIFAQGFYIRRDPAEEMDIFRLQGLSQRMIIISERLKGIFIENGVKGVKYIETGKYCMK